MVMATACLAVAALIQTAVPAANSLAARQAAAEQVRQAPTFRAGTQLIEIDVRVTDRDGQFVNGLSREDFELLDDGEPQRIDLFSFVNIPTRSDQIEQLGAGASSVKADGDGAVEGRTYAMLLDGPAGGADHVQRMRSVARLFLDQAFGPTDQMGVTFVKGKFQADEQMVEQPFTTNRRAIEAAVDRLAPGTRAGTTGEGAVKTYETIEDISNRLGAMGGHRKALVWIGGRVPFDPSTQKRGAEIAFAYRDAIRAANRNNVAIYPIDLLGLTNELSQPFLLVGRGGAGLKRMAALRVVADDTGGESVVGTNNYAESFAQIARDTRTYYLLGYQAKVGRCDGRFHAITVRVKRAGASVHARKGYFAPEPSKSPTPSANREINSTPSGVCK